MRSGTAARRLVGYVLLAALPGGLALAATSPVVAEPAVRVLRTVLRDLRRPSRDDPRHPVPTTEGVSPGDPAFLVAADGTARPVAHVLAVEPGALVLRFAPGMESLRCRASVHPKGRTAREAIELAMPPEVARALGEDLLARARQVWREAIEPDASSRLPAFFARLDPEKDEATRKLLDVVGAGVFARLQPLANDLADTVTKALDDRFDFLDRMGLLWRFVRGDAAGLKRQMLPAAEEAARAWWATRRPQVLAAIGEGLRAHGGDVETWVRERLLVAAREELAEPILGAHAARLEAEAGAWLGRVIDEVVVAPDGGFRRRFATVLRHHLLDKDDALVLLERTP
jgi:hypothetical protein